MSSEQARTKLLDAAVAYALEHGIGELTLRDLAAAIGTSHRMLIYHFGSKEALLVAVTRAVEQTQLEFLTDLSQHADLSPMDASRVLWQRLASPAMRPQERLFFELYVRALQGQPGTTGLLDDIVSSWVEPTAAYLAARGVPLDAARTEARLGVAVTRGLLLDLLATGDLEGVTDALECFLAQYEQAHANPRR